MGRPAAESGLKLGGEPLDDGAMMLGRKEILLKAQSGLPHQVSSWEWFPTESKDSFPSVGMDAGLQLRHGLSYGHQY